MHIHTDTQILQLCGVISQLFWRFYLCIKWGFVCDVNIVQHGLTCEMQRAGFTLLIAVCCMRYWLSDLATWISKAFVCLMCSFTGVTLLHVLRKSYCSPWCASLKQHSCQVHWGDSFLDAGVTQCLKSYRRCHVLAFSCVIPVTLTPPLQSEMNVSLHPVSSVAWANISL